MISSSTRTMARKRGGGMLAVGAVGFGTVAAMLLAGCHPRVGSSASATQHTTGSMNRTASIDVARTLQRLVSQMRTPAPGTESGTMRMSFGDLPPLLSPDQLTTHPPQGGGIVVFEPVPASDVAAPDADFAAGCGYYLNFAVGGQPALGQTPLTYSISRNKREHFAMNSLRLSLGDAVSFAKAVGATETAVGTIDRLAPRTSGELALTYRLIDVNTARPIGEPLVVRGTPTAILAALPDVASRLARQAGVAHPVAMPSPAATPELLAAELRTHRRAHPKQNDVALVTAAAPRDPIALLYVLEFDKKISAATFAADTHLLLTKLAPDNPRAWGDVAGTKIAMLLPLRSNLAALRKAYPNNYALAQTDAWLDQYSGSPRAEFLASEDAARAAPNDPDAWVLLGGILGSFGQALRQNRPADAITPAEWNTLVALYTCQEEYDRRAVTLDPYHRSAWIYLSASAMLVGDRAGAEDAYHKAVYYDPDKAVVYGWGLQLFQDKWGGKAADLKAVAQTAASENYPKIENTGTILIDLKDAGFPAEAKALRDRALIPFDVRIKTNPDDVYAHWQKASLLWHDNNMPAACREYAFVARKLPNSLEAQIDYADVLERMNQLPQAVAEWTAVLKRDPQNRSAPWRLGHDLRELGQTTMAEKWLIVSSLQYPNSIYVHRELAQLYEQRDNYPASAEEYRRTFALGDRSPVLYANFAWLLNHMSKYPEAIHWGEEGVGLYRSNEESLTGIQREDVSMLHAALAYAYLKSHRNSDAKAQNAAALALNSHNPAVLTNQEHLSHAK